MRVTYFPYDRLPTGYHTSIWCFIVKIRNNKKQWKKNYLMHLYKNQIKLAYLFYSRKLEYKKNKSNKEKLRVRVTLLPKSQVRPKVQVS